MKKTICTFLAILLTIGMLGGFSAFAEDALPFAGRTLHVLGSVRRYEGEEDAWNKIGQMFKAEYGADVVFSFTGDRNDIATMISTAKLSGEQVDLIASGGNSVNSFLASSGSLLDLTEALSPIQDRFPENMLDFYRLGDKLWGIPYGNCSTCMIYYNKKVFEEYNLEIPTTYEELLAVSKVLSEEAGMIPMIHEGLAPAFWPIWFMACYAQTSGNHSVENIKAFLSNEVAFAGEAEQEAFDWIARFFADGICSMQSLEVDGEGMRASFARGEAAMIYNGAWENANLNKVVTDFEIGTFPFPRLLDDETILPLVGGGPDDGFCIPSFGGQENIDIALQFLEFITREENVNIVISCYSPSARVVNGVEIEETPYNTVYSEQLAPLTIPFLDWIWPTEINETFKNAIPAVIAGNTTAEEACKSVEKTLARLIEEEDYIYDWWNTWSEDQWKAVTISEIPVYEVK